MTSKLCPHFLSLKPQKLSNLIKVSSYTCKSSKKHQPIQFQLCLICGQSRCQSQLCSYQHYQILKHTVALNMNSKEVYCFTCKKFIHDMIAEVSIELQNQSIGEKEKGLKKITVENVRKSLELVDKVIELVQRRDQELSKLFYPVKGNQNQSNPKVQQKIQQKEFRLSDLLDKTNINSNTHSNNTKRSQIHSTKDTFSTFQNSQLKLHTFGLANIGNTCYFNSVLQCMYATEKLHNYYKDNPGNEVNIIFKKFLSNKERIFCPKNLFSAVCKNKTGFRSMEQQDAQELYGLLLNSLIQGEKKAMKITKQKQDKIFQQTGGRVKITGLQKIFGFFLASCLQCLDCPNISWTFDFALDLAIQLCKTPPKPSNPSTHSKEIPTFFDNFFSKQLLTSKNYYKCQKCKSSKSYRTLYLKQPPQILMVGLKRFKNDGSKNNAIVKVPQFMDLGKYVYEDKKQHYQGQTQSKGYLGLSQDMVKGGPLVRYQIYAGVVHGGSSGGGHYVAYTRRNEEQWFYFSDSQVKQSSWERFKSAQPYLLFYKKLDFPNEKQEQFDKEKQQGLINSVHHKRTQPKVEQNIQGGTNKLNI